MRDARRPRPGDRIIRISRVKAWRFLLPLVPRPRAHPLPSLLLIYGFAGLIAIGTVLLMLPISSKSGQFTSPVNALFTATSAVCVTGLVLVDTGDYWSTFGQAVLLVLVQLGGLGFMTAATLFLLMLGRRIGLRERLLIRESMGLARLGGLLKLVRRIALFTLLVEAVGAAIFYVRFSVEASPTTAAWRSVFHAISAFNNAGFDLFGNFGSLTNYRDDTLVVLTTAAIVILGGISFIVIADVFSAKRFSRLTLDSKLVLTTTLGLLSLGMLVILITESFNPDTLGTLPLGLKLQDAFFQSVTARTAGFSTIDVGNMADYALFFIILLMFIGGASGSTAGGIKVNTFGLMVATVLSSIRGREYAGVYHREFTHQGVYRALVVATLSLALVSIVVLALTVTEQFPFLALLFETVSGFANAGLTTGITPDLSTAGRLIITATMFIGRLGPLTLALATAQRQQQSTYRYPRGTVRIG